MTTLLLQRYENVVNLALHRVNYYVLALSAFVSSLHATET